MNTRRLTWGVLLVLTILSFYSWIPVSIYRVMPFLLAFIGAGLFLFFLVQLIADFNSLRELNARDPWERDWRHQVVPWLVLPAFVMIFVFGMHASARERKAIRLHGMQVRGVITSGVHHTQRGGFVTVLFTTASGKQMKVLAAANTPEFNMLREGQEVELVYSLRDPSQVELVPSRQ